MATDILEASARAFVRAISNALEGVAIREAEEATADAAVERTPAPNAAGRFCVDFCPTVGRNSTQIGWRAL